ncbi:MAG: ABC transporter ATP-binding protein [Bacillota bacterium]|jgi:branched-chain amino acid transport system ATP-binding protein
MSVMLKMEGVYTHYDRIPMMIDVSMQIKKGQVVCLLGANGAGKTTLLKTILGMVAADRGRIYLADRIINDLPAHKRVEMGIAMAAASFGNFPKMTIEANLKMGAYYIKDKDLLRQRLEEVFQIFPVLKERLQQKAGTLSGGERTMLTIACAIINKPQLLLMDEPSLGLSPLMVEEVYRIIEQLNQKEGMTILLAEQNIQRALQVAHFGYILQKGQVTFAGDKRALLHSEYVTSPII